MSLLGSQGQLEKTVLGCFAIDAESWRNILRGIQIIVFATIVATVLYVAGLSKINAGYVGETHSANCVLESYAAFCRDRYGVYCFVKMNVR